MTRVNATFDGEVFRPDEPVPLPPNTRVGLTVGAPEHPEADVPHPNGDGEPNDRAPSSSLDTAFSLNEEEPGALHPNAGEPYSFLKAAREAKLDGPPDWSTRIDEYLYGTAREGADD